MKGLGITKIAKGIKFEDACCKLEDKFCFQTIIHKIFPTNFSFFVKKVRYYGIGLMSVFQEFFTSLNKIFNLPERLGSNLSFHENLRYP